MTPDNSEKEGAGWMMPMEEDDDEEEEEEEESCAGSKPGCRTMENTCTREARMELTEK